MKDKFIKIISPITLAITLILDAAVIYFAVFAIKKLLAFVTSYAIVFAIMEIFAIVIAVLMTKNILTQGVIFRENELEFTALDENNIVAYEDIIDIETSKDDKISLKKNFNDRHSFITFKLKEDKELVVDIGLTTKKTLKSISEEIKSRIY